MEKVDKAIEYLWLVIEEAKGMLGDEKLLPSEKKAWATVLGNTISILNKILSSQEGEQKVDKDKIARLISQLPKKYVRIIEKGFAQAHYEYVAGLAPSMPYKKNQKIPSPDGETAQKFCETACLFSPGVFE